MAFELATVLLGAIVGAIAVLYAAPKGYLGHRRYKYTPTATSIQPVVVAPPEPVPEVKAAEPEPAPAPAPAPEPVHVGIYETVQPPAAPVTYAAPASTSFGAPTLAKKPVRTYRRRTAPVRSVKSSAPSKVAKKSKKR
jgi:hypothetical protein